jgi:flagellar basal body-associated protein FliL
MFMASPENTKVESSAGLEEIDRLLDQEDPSFNQEIKAVKDVAADANVQIVSEASDDSAMDAEEAPAAPMKPWKRWWNLRKANMSAQVRRFKTVVIMFVTTVPKDFALFSLSLIKGFFRILGGALKAFGNLSKGQKFGMILVVLMLGATAALVIKNVRGNWLPTLLPPILSGFNEVADHVYEYNPATDTIPFFKAFPQDPELYLFGKIKVNLRRNSEHPMPMGAFELYVQVDSRDTAIELQSRHTEFSDLLHRVFEELTYNELVSELGKNRAKDIIKRDLSKELTQGWITDVHFKTFILKP